MLRMDPDTTTHESGTAGKPGETTAAASSAAQSVDPKNLTPAGVTSLLDSAFSETPATPRKPGEGVQPGDPAKGGTGGDKSPKRPTEPEWTADQQAWFDLRSKATTDDEIAAADAQAPQFTAEQRAWIEAQEGGETTQAELPAEVLAQVQTWEQGGGALPKPLQEIVDKRIGREVGKVKELEQRATKAEAEVERLTAELETGAGERGAPGGAFDKKSLNAMVDTCKKFQADARAVLGGYGSQEQRDRLDKHMQTQGMDENEVRRQLDQVNDWLTEEVPQLRKRVENFRAEEAKVIPMVRARFPSLEDKGSEDAKFAGEVAKLMPELKERTPAYRLGQGLYVLGKVAFEHLNKASAEGDIVQALRDVLQKHVPLPLNGNGKGKFFLPGKAPKKAPTGRGFVAPRVDGNRAQEEAASAELASNPTAENVIKTLKIALR
jgi:uncharacterized small protein (DUF1192 family)